MLNREDFTVIKEATLYALLLSCLSFFPVVFSICALKAYNYFEADSRLLKPRKFPSVQTHLNDKTMALMDNSAGNTEQKMKNEVGRKWQLWENR